MVFFDEIDKKITQFGQGVTQKTKEVSDSAKISGAIKNLENQKKDCYTALGERFYFQYQALANEEDNMWIEKINSINNEILQQKEQMSRLKGIIYCPNCNSEIPFNSQFCNVCGSKIEQKQYEAKEVTKKVCTQCGGELAEEDKFCTHCGASVEAMNEKKELAEKVAEQVCPKCGTAVKDGQAFCVYCGNALN